jgi:hypothetical protein
MNKKLLPTDVDSIRAIAEFAKNFAVDVVRVSPTTSVVGIDDVPTLAVFITPKIPYSGPEIILNRLRILHTRLDKAESVSIELNAGGNPYNLLISGKRSSVDFRLATLQQGKRLPAAFTGTFAYDLVIKREYFTEMLAGAKAIGATFLQFTRRDGLISGQASEGGESFSYKLLDDDGTPFVFNYAIEHLSTVEKLTPEKEDIRMQITPRGQLSIKVSTAGVDADVFILDHKNR